MDKISLGAGFSLELREGKDGFVNIFVHDDSGKAPVKALSLGVRKGKLVSYPVVRRTIDYNGQHWREEELLTPEGRPDVIQLHSGKLFCKKCRCFVQNTANNEMRREGFFAHSHVCDEQNAGETDTLAPSVVDSYDASDKEDKRTICTVAYKGETYDVMCKLNTGLMYVMEGDNDPVPASKDDENAIIAATKQYLKSKENM